jgi:hypothetical protein
MLKVVESPIESRRDIERLLARMREAGLKDVVVIGFDKDGEFWTDITFADGPTVLWLMELAKAKVLEDASAPK